MSSWVFVCDKDELPQEEVKRFDFEGRTYAIYHGVDGNWYATDGLCSHEDVHLGGGFVFDFIIECPKHNGQFDYRTGEAMGPPVCRAIRTYPVKAQDDGIYLEVASGLVPVRELPVASC
jgi:3-phenylpropionate/trans-cinnamate dioxygenase ferredoxin component